MRQGDNQEAVVVPGWAVILLAAQQCGVLALRQGQWSAALEGCCGWIQLFGKDRLGQEAELPLMCERTGVHRAASWGR